MWFRREASRPNGGDQMASSGTQAIDRAADLLSRVVQHAGTPTATELTAETGYARSTTSRLLSALERNHLLRREEEGGWAPGALFEQYAAQWDVRGRLVRLAAPVMAALSEETGETINLGVGLGDTVVQIAQVDSIYLLGSRDWVGVDLPAHTSSLGKMLYAHGVIDRPAGALEQLTPRTVGSWEELAAGFREIRTRGWASTVDELEVGLTGIAAPVYVDGRVVAGLGLSGPSTRLAHRIPAVGAVVAAHAADLSARLSTSARKVRHDAG
ncbi:IclR family transcriptional regulator [Ornithinimicrobium avium]|uniref:IclR family transcriptional regulator n=1 Tax=Ornithinimicrobium avium TaxID=2283195 RepID=A0A345NR02_9MICO|nr:IclR family transcriptional regulator [Ornithinimicrobium avium]AXH97460.1 IclR family transcriptional regulator [Ornithinimicrobium avium]